MPEHDSRDLNPVNEFVRQFDERLSAQIKSLLEEKHVYQKVTIEPEKISAEILTQVKGDQTLTERQIAFALDNSLALSSGGPLRLVICYINKCHMRRFHDIREHVHSRGTFATVF